MCADGGFAGFMVAVLAVGRLRLGMSLFARLNASDLSVFNHVTGCDSDDNIHHVHRVAVKSHRLAF